MSENSIRLTQYSHGAGCGCKISPKCWKPSCTVSRRSLLIRICLWVMKPATMRRYTIWAMAPALSVPPTSLCRSLIILSILAALRRLTPSAISLLWAANRLWRLRSSAGRLTNFPGNCPRSDRRWTLCMPSGGDCAGWRSLHRCAGADFWSGGNGDRTDRAGEENSTAQAGCKLFLTKPLGIGVLTTAEKNHC